MMKSQLEFFLLKMILFKLLRLRDITLLPVALLILVLCSDLALKLRASESKRERDFCERGLPELDSLKRL